MMIKTGFNTDFGKFKYDIGLDEADLARILAAKGIPPDAEITTLEAYKLLRLTAERFCVQERSQNDPSFETDVRAAVARLSEQLDDGVDKIKARLGLGDHADGAS